VEVREEVVISRRERDRVPAAMGALARNMAAMGEVGESRAMWWVEGEAGPKWIFLSLFLLANGSGMSVWQLRSCYNRYKESSKVERRKLTLQQRRCSIEWLETRDSRDKQSSLSLSVSK
jgi:membrane-bound lytic murein transglycosylase MltF